ncbi:MAG: ATP-binding protein, partial [Calditrichaeota bacterium]
SFPTLHINEYVVWEILEPLIQNSIDHAVDENIKIWLVTRFDPDKKRGLIEILDNGPGINHSLLEKNEQGIRKIFQENITTKTDDENRGYGCFLAYEICLRCGWQLDVTNKPDGGAHFFIRITGLS